MHDAAPTPADMGRDLAADLALCGTATPPPWRADPPWGLPWEVGGDLRCHDTCVTVARTLGNSGACNLPQLDSEQACRDAAFIAAAREGWPAAIRRALAAEAEVAALKAVVDPAGLSAEATPGPWRVEQGLTHLEVRAPHQAERAVARVYDEFDARLICALRNAASLRGVP